MSLDKSILEQGKAIVVEDDTLTAGVNQDGAQVGLNKTLERGWSVIAWAQRTWAGVVNYGAGLRKKF